jgi:uncharacterized cupin superfamily protein
MNAEEFEQQMARDGFTRPIAGHYEADRFNAPHSHPFEVRGLIVHGEMTITPVGGAGIRYRTGDVFVMPLSAQHQERVGPEGCAYLWGKREP